MSDDRCPPRPVIACHLILTCYGFWLPNDPRGSGSDQVWSDALKPFGPATKVNTRHSVAAQPHDASIRRAAKKALQRTPVRLSGPQARAVAHGFGDYYRAHQLVCHACCVMPDHAHLVVKRGEYAIERFAIGLKAAAVHRLLEIGCHPYQGAPVNDRPKLWARGERKIFLFDSEDIRRSIEYVRNNPIKCGFRPQRWSFVTPYV